MCVTPIVVLNWKDEEFGQSDAELDEKLREKSEGVSSRGTVRESAPFDAEMRNSLNFYHGEATMETKLPEDAVHRSLIARMLQFGLDPSDYVRHMAIRNAKLCFAVSKLNR